MNFDGPRWEVFAVLLGFALSTTATADDSIPHFRVTATVAPLAWLISQVAGPEVVVESLVSAGESPETFQPTDRQITGVARSALFFRVGVPAENGPWLRTVEASGSTRVVDLRQGVELLAMAAGHHHHDGHHHDGHHHQESHRADDSPARGRAPGDDGRLGTGLDPHIWLSPSRLAVMVATIAPRLGEIDPRRADRYAARADELTARLDVLDAELRTRLAPVEGRAFFVFHPAWGYFAHDYGLRQVAIEIEGQEPTEVELTRLLREARGLAVRTIFVQPQVSSATPRNVARILDARLETLDPLAPDVIANLRLAGEKLLAALEPAGGGV